MHSFIIFFWTGTLLAVFAKPLPSDMFYSDFLGSASEGQGDSLFGDIASTDLIMEGFPLQESSSQVSSETGNLWTSGSGNYDMLSPVSSQDPMISEDSDLLMSSCGGTEVQKRDQLIIRDGGVCVSSDEPLKFKIPTIPPLTVPKKPSQTEVVPTLGRLRWGLGPGNQDPICSVEPYEHHLCCDGPMGDEAMDFGDLQVYTPVKNCLPGTGIVPCSTPPPFDVCCTSFVSQSNGQLSGVFCLKNSM